MWSVIAMAVSSEVGRMNRVKNNNHTNSLDKSRFNRTGYPCDKGSRLDLQCKFFGFKPKRFISVYANKPRILVKVKTEKAVIECNDDNRYYLIRQANNALIANMQSRGLSDLGRQQMNAHQGAVGGLGFLGGSGTLAGMGQGQAYLQRGY